jgi:hypothetical protein
MKLNKEFKMEICISQLKEKITLLNPQRKYVRVEFDYKNLGGFGIYLTKELLKFKGVASIYEDKIIFSKTPDSRKYIGIHQIEISNLKIVKFTHTDLRKCWEANNDFFKNS